MLYGGDEIGALVFDPGHHSLRVGYAQEDTPKAEIPAFVGVAADDSVDAMDIETKPNNVTSKTIILKHFLLCLKSIFARLPPHRHETLCGHNISECGSVRL